MTTYRSLLPELFEGYEMSQQHAGDCVDLLMYQNDLPNGSSFAVTVDTEPGNRVLWLSKASETFLKTCGML